MRSRALKLAVVVALSGLVGIGYCVDLMAALPRVDGLARDNPGQTALMVARGGERRQQWVPLADISPQLINAVLMGEDAGFYGHNGFDTHEIKEAFRRNWEQGRTVRGASTITQQLAKNLFLSTERTYTRKLKEAILTYRLENALSKSRILEIYLNVIEWGDGIYGVEAAALEVFGKSAQWLDAGEAATLAAMIPNPRELDPCAAPKRVKIRRERILNWMHGAGDLSDEELRRSIAAAPRLRRCSS